MKPLYWAYFVILQDLFHFQQQKLHSELWGFFQGTVYFVAVWGGVCECLQGYWIWLLTDTKDGTQVEYVGVSPNKSLKTNLYQKDTEGKVTSILNIFNVSNSQCLHFAILMKCFSLLKSEIVILNRRRRICQMNKCNAIQSVTVLCVYVCMCVGGDLHLFTWRMQ